MAGLPTIPASSPVTITPPATPPVYDKWWLQTCTIDGSDTQNVKAIVTLRRSRTDDKGVVQWMMDTESQASGVAASVNYVVEHVLDRAAGTYTPPLGLDGKPVADPLLTPQIQGLLAQIAGGLLGAVTSIGQTLKVL